MQTYHFSTTVVDGRGNRHLLVGTVEAESGDLRTAAGAALNATFARLVGPNRTVHTCGGPYDLRRLELTKEDE